MICGKVMCPECRPDETRSICCKCISIEEDTIGKELPKEVIELFKDDKNRKDATRLLNYCKDYMEAPTLLYLCNKYNVPLRKNIKRKDTILNRIKKYIEE